MKTVTVLFAFILILSLVLITNANPTERHLNDELKEQLLDYLREAKREDLLQKKARLFEDQIERRRLQNEIERRLVNMFETDEDNNSDSYKTFNTRRKIVHDWQPV
ncbi:unnamed protein product [Rotaria sp. Silwood1]|nr:unnamed protein product [Rotaria sp. Silwood1]CAF3432236.1 unnamed protein product [Rotaria sp. Silwood1]CAF3490199.1 unnamed protein product [Rotaria sp. Silwood1]CAF4710649.1 unnamed protein product [Rotaria sp. Silwood1]CAF4934836.1 unnamed protein product [Rotaria sp. Silwood1]